ncbi:MAG: sterol desaturase family protein, partial [Gammaproteobacteria bacterium]
MPEPLQHEALWRFASFLAVLLLMATWEWLAPRRGRCLPRRLRWPHNLALAAIDALLIRLLFPASALGFAVLAETRGWGLMQMTQAGAWPAILATVVALDCVIYWQHRLFHALPSLWRVHRVHHADVDLDVSTGLRFHPLEILLSMLIKAAAILLLGAPAAGVLLFEILLNGTAMFNHANVRLPPAADRLLRLVIVTPDMHRVHHSVRRE